ncbi:dipeptidase, partial [Brevibacterium paucivorans]
VPFGAQIEFGASEFGSPWQADESDLVLGKALEAHSANESLYLPDFKRAIVSEALLLKRLGERA